MNDGANLYIDLLKKSVGNFIYDDDLDLLQGKFSTDSATGLYIAVEANQADPQRKFYGAVWPSRAHTMIGMLRLDNIQQCVEEILATGVEGDFIETGVWRGGAAIFMRGLLKAYGVTNRKVWAADSFQGLPPGNREKYPKECTSEFHRIALLAVSLEEVRRNFARYGLLDDQVCFLKGWFRDTLPTAPIEKLALLRLDGDLYESTTDALVHLYPKLSAGGFVIIDDYDVVEACNHAVHDFRSDHQITDPLLSIENGGAFWKKGAASGSIHAANARIQG